MSLMESVDRFKLTFDNSKVGTMSQVVEFINIVMVFPQDFIFFARFNTVQCNFTSLCTRAYFVC